MSNIKKIRLAFVAIFCCLAVAIAALITSICVMSADKKTASAEGGSVIVYVYDPLEQYDHMAGWFWCGAQEAFAIAGAAPTSGDAKDFADGKNVCRPFEVKLNDSSIEKLKSGSAQLGFLFVHNKDKNPKDATEANFWHGQYGNGDKDIDGDVYISLKDRFDANNQAVVYYVRKGKDAYIDLKEANLAKLAITNARFTSVTGSGANIYVETTAGLTSESRASIYTRDADGKETPVHENIKLVPDQSAATAGKITCGTVTTDKLKTGAFSFENTYMIKVEKPAIINEAPIVFTNLVDTKEFITQFETEAVQNMTDFGATYTKEKTMFKVWAPFASKVSVKIYNSGDTEDELTYKVVEMKKFEGDKWNGVWTAEVEEDLLNKFYTYAITNYGTESETIDPYAKACGVNGDRGMIVDFKSSATNPVGWDKDKHLFASAPDAADMPIIWELQVKDFSASPDSGMRFKGKYLAFTEKDTHVPGDTSLKTGVDYLKDLGITYIHLNPVYDFGSVDEGTMQTPANREDFNWGYDPQNYNIPEGSYSTDPYNGNVRINEFKQMVMALHEAGIGVIMDVVYNHTYGNAQALHMTVPYYYHRTNANGGFGDGSGCGNDTASERSMMRKYMIESVKYWAEEYHIDGFRFDLMGVHDTNTMNMLRSELDSMNLSAIDGSGANGRKILIYGEPWTGGSCGSSFERRFAATSSAIDGTGKYTLNTGNSLMCTLFQWPAENSSLNKLDPRVAVFNGWGRNGVRGESWDIDCRDGWIQTGGSDAKLAEYTRGMIWGSLGSMDYKQNVAYASVHDNFTLWDHLTGKSAGYETPLNYDPTLEDRILKNQTVAGVYLMSRGMSLMIAGEEMARTKAGNHNSYNSTIKINQINWSRQKDFKKVYDFYKKVIAVRKAYKSIFSYQNGAITDGSSCDPNSNTILKLTFKNGNDEIKAVFNSSDSDINLSDIGYSTTGYNVYVMNGNTMGGGNTLKAKSCVIFGTKVVN